MAKTWFSDHIKNESRKRSEIRAIDKATAFIHLLKSTSIEFLLNADEWGWVQNIYRQCIETIDVLTIDYNSDFFRSLMHSKKLFSRF